MGLDKEAILKELGVDDEEKMKKLAIAAVVGIMSKETTAVLKDMLALPIPGYQKEQLVMIFISAYSFGRKDAMSEEDLKREPTEEDIEKLKEFIEDAKIL